MIPPLSLPRESHLSSAPLEQLRRALTDRYLVERELGQGGAATVYLAKDLRHERLVALKVFRPELAEAVGVDRFTREIHLAAALQHPHILPVHDSGVADGLFYYVMPYVEGESLRARVERSGELPIPDAIRILNEVADALAYAHRAGIVHRDIKPDNVLLSGRHVLVADFGIAKALSGAANQQTLTATGLALGTPAYMAPEQAAADPHVDHRADIYAFGALGYELLTGEAPFVRRTAQQTIAAHMAEPAPRVTTRRPATPPMLDALIARCLEKQPSDRWQSAEEIVAELERILTPTSVPPTQMIVTGSSRRWIGIAAASVAVVAAAWFGYAKFAPRSSADAKAVAVLPFDFSASPDLAYLREGIVNLIESNLTGEGGPRALSSQTSIAQWKKAGGDQRTLTDDEGRAIARAMGAGQVIRGSIVGTGSNVVFSATMTSSSPGGKPHQARESGPSDSIASIALRLANTLIALDAGEGTERARSLQAVPPAALRAYLEGQGAYRNARYADAIVAFDRALSIDSTFALAGISHAIATSFNVSTFGTSNGTAIAFRHRDRLSARDLILLEMASPGRFVGRVMTGRELIEIRERLAAKIPDRPEAWYLVGDTYLHYGPAFGYSRDESIARALSAFQRALALDPGIGYLRAHLADVAWAINGDDQQLIHLVDSLNLEAPYYQFARAFVAGDSARVRQMRAEFASMPSDPLTYVGLIASSMGASDAATDAFRIVTSRPASPLERLGVLRTVRSSLLSAGRMSEASTTRARIAAIDDASDASVANEDVYAAAFLDADNDVADRVVRRIAQRVDIRKPPTSPANHNDAWLIGFRAAHQNDTATLRAAIRYFDVMNTLRDTTGIAQLGRVYATMLRIVGDTARPNAALVAQADSMLHDGPAVIAARSAMNIIVARSFERLGDSRRAAATASRLGALDLSMLGFYGLAMREQSRLLLAAGDTTAALRVSRMYLRMRGKGDASQKVIDDEVRARVAAIETVKR